MEKEIARAKSKTAVEKLTAKQRFAYSADISRILLDFISDKKVESVFIYMSVSGEVSTISIINELLKQEVEVYIPKIFNDDMLLTKLTDNERFVLNKYGIPESEMEGMDKIDCDLNVIPVVSFDNRLNRCGHGKGYYDKYLSRSSGIKIGLAFSVQEVDLINDNDFDIPLDCVITEKGIIEL